MSASGSLGKTLPGVAALATEPRAASLIRELDQTLSAFDPSTRKQLLDIASNSNAVADAIRAADWINYMGFRPSDAAKVYSSILDGTASADAVIDTYWRASTLNRYLEQQGFPRVADWSARKTEPLKDIVTQNYSHKNPNAPYEYDTANCVPTSSLMALRAAGWDLPFSTGNDQQTITALRLLMWPDSSDTSGVAHHMMEDALETMRVPISSTNHMAHVVDQVWYSGDSAVLSLDLNYAPWMPHRKRHFYIGSHAVALSKWGDNLAIMDPYFTRGISVYSDHLDRMPARATIIHHS